MLCKKTVGLCQVQNEPWTNGKLWCLLAHQGACWPPCLLSIASSHYRALLNPGSPSSSLQHAPYPKLLRFLGFPSPKFSILHNSAISALCFLGSLTHLVPSLASLSFFPLSLCLATMAGFSLLGHVQSLFSLPVLDPVRCIWLCSPSCLQQKPSTLPYLWTAISSFHSVCFHLTQTFPSQFDI